MLHDLRYALRTLRQNPGFALTAIISIALGIGATAASSAWEMGSSCGRLRYQGLRKW